MKKLSHLVAAMLLVVSGAMLIPTQDAEAFFGWMNRWVGGNGWGNGWGGYPYYGGYGYPYYRGGYGYPYYGGGYPYYGGGYPHWGLPYYGHYGYPYVPRKTTETED